MLLKRGEEAKRRALNLVKKIKFRKEERKEKNRDTENPDIDISIEEIRRRIRQKESAEAVAEENEVAEGGAEERQGLDETTCISFIRILFIRIIRLKSDKNKHESSRSCKALCKAKI